MAVIARVHLVHLMNVEWRQAATGPRPARRLRLSLPVQAARVYTNHCHVLLHTLLSPKADTHFTVPRRLEGWVCHTKPNKKLMKPDSSRATKRVHLMPLQEHLCNVLARPSDYSIFALHENGLVGTCMLSQEWTCPQARPDWPTTTASMAQTINSEHGKSGPVWLSVKVVQGTRVYYSWKDLWKR